MSDLDENEFPADPSAHYGGDYDMGHGEEPADKSKQRAHFDEEEEEEEEEERDPEEEEDEEDEEEEEEEEAQSGRRRKRAKHSHKKRGGAHNFLDIEAEVSDDEEEEEEEEGFGLGASLGFCANATTHMYRPQTASSNGTRPSMMRGERRTMHDSTQDANSSKRIWTPSRLRRTSASAMAIAPTTSTPAT